MNVMHSAILLNNRPPSFSSSFSSLLLSAIKHAFLASICFSYYAVEASPLSTVLSEPFNYTPNQSLHGLSGGSGWSGAWSINHGILNVTNISFWSFHGYPPSSGNKLMVPVAIGSSVRATRPFTRITSGKIFFAWLMNYQNPASNSWAGLSLYDGWEERAFVGKISYGSQVLGVASYNHGIGQQPSPYILEGHPGIDYLIVGRYDFDNKTLSAKAFHLGTTTLPPTEPSSWDVVVNIDNVYGVDRLAINCGSSFQETVGDVYIDEIRIANTWAKLIGAAPPSYKIDIARDYSHVDQQVHIAARAYDRATGSLVTGGSGTARLIHDGQFLDSSALTFSASSGAWTGSLASTVTGTLGLLVEINGQEAYAELSVLSSTQVLLSGIAIDDLGNPLNGVSIQLYRSSDILGGSLAGGDLPPPAETAITEVDGTFDLGTWEPGAYFIRVVKADHFSLSPQFRIMPGAIEHHETVVHDRRLTAVRHGLIALARGVHLNILQQQTRMMALVSSRVDGDLDVSLGANDWIAAGASIALGSVDGIGKAVAKAGANLTAKQAARTIQHITIEELLANGTLASTSLSREKKAAAETAMRLSQGIAMLPYEAIPMATAEEYGKIADAYMHDISLLINPEGLSDLSGLFSSANPVHDRGVPSSGDFSVTFPSPPDWHSDLSHGTALNNEFPSVRGWTRWDATNWYVRSLHSYAYATNRLLSYNTASLETITSLPPEFSAERAEEILRGSQRQLMQIQAGSSLIFVSPIPSEASSTHSLYRPLALNLADFYQQYTKFRDEKQGWKGVGNTFSALSSAATIATKVGTVILPAALPAGALAIVSFTGTVISEGFQIPITEEMARSYIEMTSKYCANLISAPEVLGRTADFIKSEIIEPYYLNQIYSFGGKIENITIDLSFGPDGVLELPAQPADMRLPYAPIPPIPLTVHISCPMTASSGALLSGAHFRIEAKASGMPDSGGFDHFVVDAGWLDPGDEVYITMPFSGSIAANSFMMAKSWTINLWAGPFLIAQSDAVHVRIVPPTEIPLTIQGSEFTEEQSVKSEDESLTLPYIRTAKSLLTKEDVQQMSDRLREIYHFELLAGSNLFERTFSFNSDIFASEFRLYKPLNTDVSFHVERNGNRIGWDPHIGMIEKGLPGHATDDSSSPQYITLSVIDNEQVTVIIELRSLHQESIPMVLEVWEQPVRDAVLAALPSEIDIITRGDSIRSLAISIGENSGQQPLEDVEIQLTPIRNYEGQTLQWSSSLGADGTTIWAGDVRTYPIEVDLVDVADGIYTGLVSVMTSNAGTVEVPVSITIDSQAPTVTILPIREWWHRETGPVISWIGHDNVSNEDNIRYSKRVVPTDESWSGFVAANSRDMSELPDGEYLFSVVARDQALNVTDPAESVLVQIDREGNQFRQRIVDADPNISDVSQVNWHDDWDGDGVSNWLEFLAGTDPTNPNDVFAFMGPSASPDGFTIKWQAKRGITYQVRRTTDLVNEPWSDAPTGAGVNEKSLITAVNDGEQVYHDHTLTIGPIFYKIVIQE
jgi:hypothetical protein